MITIHARPEDKDWFYYHPSQKRSKVVRASKFAFNVPVLTTDGITINRCYRFYNLIHRNRTSTFLLGTQIPNSEKPHPDIDGMLKLSCANIIAALNCYTKWEVKDLSDTEYTETYKHVPLKDKKSERWSMGDFSKGLISASLTDSIKLPEIDKDLQIIDLNSIDTVPNIVNIFQNQTFFGNEKIKLLPIELIPKILVQTPDLKKYIIYSNNLLQSMKNFATYTLIPYERQINNEHYTNKGFMDQILLCSVMQLVTRDKRKVSRLLFSSKHNLYTSINFSMEESKQPIKSLSQLSVMY